MTGANLAEVTQLAGEDRRSARILATAEAERVAAQQRIEAADAATERELRAAQMRQKLEAERRTAGRTERAEILAQRRAERAARRTERRARATARREWVGARIDYVRQNAPAVYSTGIYLMAVGGAVYGQVTAATGRGWPLVVGVAIAAAIEGLALSMALTAHQLRLAGERALAPRALTWVCALAAGGINYLGHRAADPAGAVLLAALSVAGITVWEIRSGAKHRAALRELGLLPDPPSRFGWRRWCRFPLATFAAWSSDVRERVGDQAAALLAAAEADRRRTDVANLARKAAQAAARKGDAGAAYEALLVLAEGGRVDQGTSGRTPVPAVVLPAVPTSVPTDLRPSVPTDGPAAVPTSVRPDGRTDLRTDGRTDGGTDLRPDGGPYARTRVGGEGIAQVSGPGHVEPYRSSVAPAAAWSPVSSPVAPVWSPAPSPMSSPAPAVSSPAPSAAPSPVPSAAPSPRRPAPVRSAATRTAQAAVRSVPDVSDLMGPGRTVRERVAASGRTLTRDGLIAGLRHDGHAVSSARASALLAALNAEATA